MRTDALYQKVYGCILGGALGDAFAIRTEMMHYRDIEAQYGRVTHFDALPPRRPSEQSPLERFYPFGVGWTAPESGFHPLGRWSHESGVYTDDTRYRLLLCQAILRTRGPITGEHLAAEWLNYRLMAEGVADHLPTLSGLVPSARTRVSRPRPLGWHGWSPSSGRLSPAGTGH